MDATTRSEMEARVLAAMVHRPALAPTVFHHLTRDLWASPHAFQDSRLRVLADAIWDCWFTGRDTSPVNLRAPGGDEMAEGKVNVKDLSSGEQRLFSKEDIAGMAGFMGFDCR